MNFRARCLLPMRMRARGAYQIITFVCSRLAKVWFLRSGPIKPWIFALMAYEIMNLRARSLLRYELSRSGFIQLRLFTLGVYLIMNCRSRHSFSYEISRFEPSQLWIFALGNYWSIARGLCRYELLRSELIESWIFAARGLFGDVFFRSGLTKLSNISFSGLLKLSVTRVLSVYSFSHLLSRVKLG